MATGLREQQQQTDRQPGHRGQRPVVWPFIVGALTVLVLGGAALMVVSQGETQPFDSEIVYQTDGQTALREGGPYVEVVTPVGSIGDAMTGAREGGGYVSGAAGHHPPPDPMTGAREGGDYVSGAAGHHPPPDPMTAQREG
ncbi:MAG TPA: hypothetical protein VI341_05975 [Actinomycetota bacterium]